MCFTTFIQLSIVHKTCAIGAKIKRQIALLTATQRWACKTKLLARLQTFCSARYGYVVFCLSTFSGLLRAAWRRVKLLQ